MRQFIIEILVPLIALVLLGCIFCIPAYGQNWQDEEHVWDEGKQEWVVKNKAGGRVTNTPPETGSQDNVRTRPFEGEPWEKYLPVNVRRGKRPPTQWELKEAQRKLWVKQVRTQRAMQEAEQRRQLMAWRRATGWYDARRNAGLQQGRSAYNMHMQAVSAGMNNLRYGYAHHGASCAPSRFGLNTHNYGKPATPIAPYIQPRVYTKPPMIYQQPMYTNPPQNQKPYFQKTGA